jgi:predicted ATPase
MTQRLDNGPVAMRVSSPVFVGRADQLVRVLDAVRRAGDGEPAFILVSGDAGVGKTRFIDEIAMRATGVGVRTLSGGCVQMGVDSLPYAPIVESLRRLASEVPSADFRRLVGPSSLELTRLVPDFAVAPPRTEEDSDESSRSNQGRLFEALLGLFRRLAADRPLLVIIEDLHWPTLRRSVSWATWHET